jgi:nucleoside-diphosphate-sugar epimerase
MKRILVTGATGQIGSELIPALRKKYGAGNVVAAAHRARPDQALQEAGPLVFLDVCDRSALEGIVRHYAIDTIYHLAALLSAVAEGDPQRAWEINMQGLVNVLEVARQQHCAVFFPSSIAAFGPDTPLRHTPQTTIQRPHTVYGVTKVAGELLCDYYYRRFGVDTRGVRYPGLISSVAKPGGGTTDYAVEIFYAATEGRVFTCPLRDDTTLAMMYMPDALRAAIELMEADPVRLEDRNAFNLAAMSFTPAELAAAIKKSLPDFTMVYAVDPLRQGIAENWPAGLDDSAARRQWGWQPAYDLAATVTDMLARLAARRAATGGGGGT